MTHNFNFVSSLVSKCLLSGSALNATEEKKNMSERVGKKLRLILLGVVWNDSKVSQVLLYPFCRRNETCCYVVQRLAKSDLWAKSSLLYIFISKVLRKQTHLLVCGMCIAAFALRW